MASNDKAINATRSTRAHRAWSLYVGSVAGIPIYLHFTFLLFLAFIWVISRNGATVFGGLPLLLSLFASVALHELGHALMARRFGIKTDDIVLYPIGGVARLRSMGEKLQEFWIAIAGPAVNVVIAAVLGSYLAATGRWVPLTPAAAEGNGFAALGFMQQLMLLNVILVLFNLIPAFPMDGGRVLRSLLTLAMPKERATAIAAWIGQALAILFIIVGLNGYVMLMFIGFFVFIAAGQESTATRSMVLVEGHSAGEATIRRFEVLQHGDSLGRAADLLLATSQQDFPVMGGSEMVGVLSRQALLQGLANGGRDTYVAQVMAREFPRVKPDAPLQQAFELLQNTDGLPVMVFEGERLHGYINKENLMEYLMLARAGSS